MYTKFISFLLLMSCCYNQAQVVLEKVGDNSSIVLSSAALEVASTTKGFLPPRMTNAQKNAIIDPAEGLIVYCTDCNPKTIYQYNGTNWIPLIGTLFASLTSLDCTGATSNGTLTQGTAASGSSDGTASFAISIGGTSCSLTRAVGIYDRMYGLTINGANNHNFIYYPVTGADGKTWLNNNLGAHYANQNHASFNPTQQATSATDHLAYGSLFQWGRAADGHELITWTSGSLGTPVNGTTATRPESDTAANALFVTINSGNYDWRGTTQNNNLWQGVNGTNNPCPAGYRLPTNAELTTLVTTSNITNSATAASSAMKFTVSGVRDIGVGSLFTVGSGGNYRSSSVSGTNASYRFFNSGGTGTSNDFRAYGFTVRCLKN